MSRSYYYIYIINFLLNFTIFRAAIIQAKMLNNELKKRQKPNNFEEGSNSNSIKV